MIVKWIRCTVGENRRRLFSDAQLAWAELRHVPGFLAQVGGWDRLSGQACILALWKDLQTYKAFMMQAHDAIQDQVQQQATYSAVDTALFEMIGDVPFAAAAFDKVLSKANLLLGSLDPSEKAASGVTGICPSGAARPSGCLLVEARVQAALVPARPWFRAGSTILAATHSAQPCS